MEHKEYQANFQKVIKMSKEFGIKEIESIILFERIRVDVYYRDAHIQKGILETPLRKLVQGNDMLKYWEKHKIILNDMGSVDISEINRDVLLIAFGDEEFGKTELKALDKRKEKHYNTIPFIIFSNEFFKIPYGEKFAYVDILETLSHHNRNEPVAFVEEDVRNKCDELNQFIWLISYFFKMTICEKFIEKILLELENILPVLQNEMDYARIIEKNYINFFTLHLRQKYEDIENINRLITSIKQDIYRDMCGIQERNNKNALGRRKYFIGKPFFSSYANKIGLRYGDIIRLLDEFIENVDNDKILKNDPFIVDKINETADTMNRACEMALIGTFSSGKTTFINALLGGNHHFRTSAAHNTAVLLVVKKASDNIEKYIVRYKDRIVYNLIQPADSDSCAEIYRGQVRAKVKAIDTDKRCLKLLLNGGGRDTYEIHSENKIIIKEGDVLSEGTKITDGKDPGVFSDRVKAVSREVVEFLLHCAEDDKHMYNAKLQVNSGKGNKSVEYSGKSLCKIMKQLSNLLEATPDKIYDVSTFCGVSELDQVQKLTFEANYDRNDIEIELTDKEWNTFCDSEEGTVFMERPECFVLSEQLTVKLNNSFLDYCNIVDTPGFGSVTEAHDAISERYIHNHKGILLIMIKLDNRPDKLSLATLLNKVSRIYESDASLDKNNVYFMLNCYSNLAGKNVLEKSCKDMIQQIKKRGFSEKKIYACNLKQSIENIDYKDPLCGLPSYKEFNRILIREIEKKGILFQLQQVCQIWGPYIKTEINRLDIDYKKRLREESTREANLQKVRENLRSLELISFISFDSIERDIKKEIQPLIDRIRNITNKKDWKKESDEICTSINSISQTFIEDDFMRRVYAIKTDEILRLTEYKGAKYPIDEKEVVKFVFPSDTIQSLYRQRGDEFWGIFWYKKDKIIEEMVADIEHETNKSLKEYKIFYDYLEKQFSKMKTSSIKYLKEQAENLSSSENLKVAIKRTRVKRDCLKRIEPKWNIIETKMAEYDER